MNSLQRQLHSLFPIFNFVKYHHRTLSRDILKRIPIANKISDAYILIQWMNIALLKSSICIGTMKQNDFILHFVQNNLCLNWTKKIFQRRKLSSKRTIIFQSAKCKNANMNNILRKFPCLKKHMNFFFWLYVIIKQLYILIYYNDTNTKMHFLVISIKVLIIDLLAINLSKINKLWDKWKCS